MARSCPGEELSSPALGLLPATHRAPDPPSLACSGATRHAGFCSKRPVLLSGVVGLSTTLRLSARRGIGCPAQKRNGAEESQDKPGMALLLPVQL